jgi:predicted RNase H-like HicB family nuclease
MTYTVVLREEPEGGYTILVPALPDVVSYGEDMADARASAAEAIECSVRSKLGRGLAVPEEDPAHPPRLPVEELTGPITIIRVTVPIEETVCA